MRGSSTPIIMKLKKRIASLLTAASLTASLIPAGMTALPAAAAGADTLSYPVQEFRLGIGDTDRSLTASGKEDGDYVSSETGYILTNDGGLAVTSADTDSPSQRWKIEAVAQDFEGYDLYYKITSAEDGSALTFDPSSNSVNVEDYTGANYQKYKLNLDGLEGFAANSLVNGKEKAGTIGGLLGETVFADSVDKFIAALDSTDPKTVVITADLDLVNQNKTQQRIPLFHGNVGCIEPLIYQMLSKHGYLRRYGCGYQRQLCSGRSADPPGSFRSVGSITDMTNRTKMILCKATKRSS